MHPASPDEAQGRVVTGAAFVYNERVAPTLPLARRLSEIARAAGRTTRVVSAWDQDLKSALEGADLAVTFGGDGTILRTARVAAPKGIPILGVNLGRLGFLTELAPEEAETRLLDYLEGRCRVEERHMLALTLDQLGPGAARVDGMPLATEYVALNDVIFGRGERARVVALDISVDGAHLASLRADGLVVASATGSTAYSLSAGGPVIHPNVGGILINPVLPHLTFLRSVVIPITSVVAVRLTTDHTAMCSIDGQIDIRLDDCATGIVRAAPFCCRFLRARPANYFYESLVDRLHGS